MALCALERFCTEVVIKGVFKTDLDVYRKRKRERVWIRMAEWRVKWRLI